MLDFQEMKKTPDSGVVVYVELYYAGHCDQCERGK